MLFEDLISYDDADSGASYFAQYKVFFPDSRNCNAVDVLHHVTLNILGYEPKRQPNYNNMYIDADIFAVIIC